jgi:hypothetical protein
MTKGADLSAIITISGKKEFFDDGALISRIFGIMLCTGLPVRL